MFNKKPVYFVSQLIPLVSPLALPVLYNHRVLPGPAVDKTKCHSAIQPRLIVLTIHDVLYTNVTRSKRVSDYHVDGHTIKPELHSRIVGYGYRGIDSAGYSLCIPIRKPPPCVYIYIRTFKIYLRICVFAYIYCVCVSLYICTKKIFPAGH